MNHSRIFASSNTVLKHEENYRNLFVNIGEAVWIATIGGIVLDANPATSEMLGSKLEDIIGNKIIGYYSNPDDRAKFIELVNKYGFVNDYEIKMKRKDGEIITCLFTATLFKNSEGKVIGYQGIVRDVTKRMLIEKELRDSEEKYRELVENANSIIAKFDKEGKILSMNEFGLNFFGYTNEELLGKTWYETILPNVESTGKVLDNLAKSIIENIDQYNVNLNENVKKNGERVWIYWTNKPIKNDNGEIIAFLSIGTDITERTKLEKELKQRTEELERSNKELEEFAYIASHDLQEPLRMITSYVQLLERRYKDKLDQDATDFIGFAVEGSTRMKSLINDLLVYSRVGTKGKEFISTDLNVILKKVLQNLQIAIEENKAGISIEKMPTIMADDVQMIQLFQNLIGNAIKFKGEDPPIISVKYEEQDKDFVFSISDNGIGIEKEYYNRIFMIFQRLHTRDQYPGTGIGLAVCRKIIERHGGKIWIESEVGKGTTFYFSIPKMEVLNG
ncbi:MAG: sensory histidine kinase AtoS [Candidatus Methanofastidiosum methylothiophilum]|uniref:histidine kinase n=1 Tax=Candidatus Methanofastidiosum methylothiophilum TaxID=1705564 RepID=A0A150J127_9EURY|nr:MAG: sensory histidine kinase AtoS [Candidatus Methanofastidiosum methylthiophilus]